MIFRKLSKSKGTEVLWNALQDFDPCEFIYIIYSIQLKLQYLPHGLHYRLPIFHTFISLCENMFVSCTSIVPTLQGLMPHGVQNHHIFG